MRRGLVISLVLVVAMSAVGGRATQAMLSYMPADELSIGTETGEEREEFHQTYPLAANGRVSLENLNGEVEIKVWDRDAVQVDAIKRAYKRERLAEAKIEINSTPEFLRIKTVYPDDDQTFTDDEKGRNNNPAVVDYSLTVPRKARLESIELVNGSLNVEGVEGDMKASSVNGRVRARGLMGETKLSTVNGELEAVFTQLSELKPIALSSVNGNVVVIIPSDSNATIKAGTVNGAISNDFGLDVQHGEYVGHELYGQLGTGGPRIKLGNVNGGIVIKHAQDGRQLSQAVCLLPNKEKEKEKEKARADQEERRQAAEAARQQNAEARRAAREAQAEAARSAREAQTESRRDVQQAIREAQREIEQAQREIQRETERQIREQILTQNRGRGMGSGAGSGRGRGESGRRLLDRESRSFAVTGQPRVNIGTFDGAVTVHGWDKQEVMYTATKRAGDEAELKQIAIQTEQQGGAVSIIAHSAEGNGSASLDVYVPRSTALHVSSDDGRLNVEGVSGDITLRTGDGSIEVNDGRGQLQVNTGDGSIHIVNFEGQVDARTGDGSISLDGNFAGLAARTGDGSITLVVPADSNFTIETDAEGISNEGLTVSEDIAPSKRLKRWKVGRGGNVFVLNTGEGQVILRPR